MLNANMKLLILTSSLFILATAAIPALADTPLGWINSSNASAYTTTRGELEIALSGLAVNDSLDIFNYREDLINANGRLKGDSGNLSGNKLELHYGVTEDIAIYYKRQDHSLTLDLSEINSVDLIDIDDSLETLAESIGLKWTFYRSNLLNSENRFSAASIELSAFSNESNDFDTVIDEIRLNNLTITFGIPQTFSIADLEDQGWKSRLIYSWAMADTAVATLWAGYGESSATSSTTSDLQSATLSRLFEQSFDLEETYFYLGAALTAHITPRFSVDLSYEYTKVSDSKLKRFPLEPLPNLPGFLSGDGLSAVDNNHTLSARLAYWLTPKLNLSITGNLFANQFVGVLPHYNNPLSGSFSSTPYGYAGVELVYKFSNLP